LIRLIIISCFLTIPIYVYAQLSPGKLTEAHSDLEGISNCTQCHSIGNKVPDSKCLDCHKEIDQLIQVNRGLHAWKETREKTCIDCHSEHHGLKFDMVRFDFESFDHNITGYELEGQHAIIDCRACHIPDNIADPKLKQRAGTFLGLGNDCLGCHEDFHQGTLSNKCIECHDFSAFRPASLFDHDNADFKLRGAHVEIDCKGCHLEENRNGQAFQQFIGIPFSDCIDCHDNPHKSNWQSTCTSCHTEESFDRFTGQSRFDHDKTDFDLKGAHNEVNCFDCHSKLNATNVFTDNKGIGVNQCASCHDDPHNGKFGNNCAECHNETGFFSLNDPSMFDHSLTDFALEGIHIEVECKDCHQGKLTDPMAHDNCYDCHNDYHKGEFGQNGVQRDCNGCHTVEFNFSYTLFGLEEHESAAFPLDGAHIATPCFECHVSEDHWNFRNIGSQCIDCHIDIHEGYISNHYYPEKNCTTCHITDSWDEVNFDHNLTNWKLTGQHQNADCKACHVELSQKGKILAQKFVNLSSDCVSCHNNPHGSQFEISGITDCNRCHVTSSWYPENFDHELTAFSLDGRHAEVECKACHTEVVNVDNVQMINFKMESFECIDCHQ
jgi:hypothetical protein